MNQRRGALAAIATLILLARNAIANATNTPQQNGKDHEKIVYIIASEIQGARC
jgi:hypothetical protein